MQRGRFMGQVSTVDDASGHPDSNGMNVTTYKIAISILFGLLGFVLNFHTINFSFPVAYPLPAAMMVLGYGGGIKVSLSYLESVLDQRAMKEFLSGFQQVFFSILDEKSLMKEPLPPFRDLTAEMEPPQIFATPHCLVQEKSP